MQDSVNQPGFLSHNYGTFGTSPSPDRPAQFAAVHADTELNVIGEPEVLHRKPTDGYLSQLQVAMTTGIASQGALAEGDNEAMFARHIHDLFTVSQTCIVGYNNVRFDDEVMWNTFHCNFYNPYAWSWQHDNSCWDLLDVMRVYYVLRPGGITWPENGEGLPSFRFEHLAVVNGIEHQNIHDMMVDTYATVAMAELVKTRQSRLFDYLHSHHNKRKLVTLVDMSQMRPLVHVSGMFGAACGGTSLVMSLAWHPENRNAVIMVDLVGDTTPPLELDASVLCERLYISRAEFGDLPAAPIKLVHLNKYPVLAQANALCLQGADRSGTSIQHRLENVQPLRVSPRVQGKVVTAYAEVEPFVSFENVDAQPYNGLSSDADRVAMKIALETKPCNPPAPDIALVDKHIERLLFNHRVYNFSGILDEHEQQCWLEHRRQVFTPEFLQAYADGLWMLYQQYTDDKGKLMQLKALWQYIRDIV